MVVKKERRAEQHSWIQIAEENAGGEMAYWGAKDLGRVVNEETEWRYRLQQSGGLLASPRQGLVQFESTALLSKPAVAVQAGCFQGRRVSQAVGLHGSAKEDSECAICHSYLHLSGVECKCCPRRFVCIRHANNLCDCPPPAWRLAYRHSIAELESIVDALAASVPAGQPLLPP